MTTGRDVRDTADEATARARRELLSGIPVVERFIRAAGLRTAVLEGGDGPPIVLLHGPGEAGVNWRWVIPDLTTTHRVIAPDLPAHGSTDTADEHFEGRVISWLDELIDQTCASPPVLVGHVLGGAIATRYAIHHGARLHRLVLNDSLGLAPFRPSRRFATAFLRFVIRPNDGSYEGFMSQCAYDLDGLRGGMGDDWASFVDYNLGLARSEKAKAAGRLFRKIGLSRISAGDLGRIETPTALIWGRHDRALRLPIAHAVSERHGWPLHVIEGAAGDPARDQPEAFVRALRTELDRPEPTRAGTPRPPWNAPSPRRLGRDRHALRRVRRPEREPQGRRDRARHINVGLGIRLLDVACGSRALSRAINAFRVQIGQLGYEIRRRSERHRLTWARMNHLPDGYHPSASRIPPRGALRRPHPRQEPSAVVPPAWDPCGPGFGGEFPPGYTTP